MNIFYLDKNPTTCAKYHVDKHVVKMILEYSQLLSTAHRKLDSNLSKAKDNILYKSTHVNHPSSVWVRNSSGNYKWLLRLLKALHKEYSFRYGKIHKSISLIDELCDLPKNINNGKFSDPPLAMPDNFKLDNAILSYRNYYVNGKSHLANWKLRNNPEWFKC
jgi:hypothetical protein